MQSAFEPVSEGFETLGMFNETSPLGIANWWFVMLKHGLCVDDAVIEILLHGAGNEADEETWML